MFIDPFPSASSMGLNPLFIYLLSASPPQFKCICRRISLKTVRYSTKKISTVPYSLCQPLFFIFVKITGRWTVSGNGGSAEWRKRYWTPRRGCQLPVWIQLPIRRALSWMEVRLPPSRKRREKPSLPHPRSPPVPLPLEVELRWTWPCCP